MILYKKQKQKIMQFTKNKGNRECKVIERERGKEEERKKGQDKKMCTERMETGGKDERMGGTTRKQWRENGRK